MPTRSSPVRSGAETTVAILLAVSFCHLLNDMLQALLPAIYPLLKSGFHLDFWQIGLITLAGQLTASLLQPLVGLYTDRHPQPYSLVIGMGCTLLGLILLATATRFALLPLAAAMVGVGSSVFHPESSRIARAASGGRFGLAQSLFQTGGNAGSALGPLMAAFIVVPGGKERLAWFSPAALLAMAVMWRIGRWYQRTRVDAPAVLVSDSPTRLTRPQVRLALGVLMVLLFSKYIYLTSISSYFTFYLIHRFDLSVQAAQLHLFVFLGAVAAGTFVGGPIGDRVGRRQVIWVSILGALPFTLAMPYANLFWTTILSAIIGLVLSSAFSAILVYATEIVPGRVGLIAGLFFGLAFGIAGLGAAALGKLADVTSIEHVYQLCSWAPALGILTVFLPDLRRSPLGTSPAIPADVVDPA